MKRAVKFTVIALCVFILHGCFESSSNGTSNELEEQDNLVQVNAMFKVNYQFTGVSTPEGWVTCRLYTSLNDMETDLWYYDLASQSESGPFLEILGIDTVYTPSYVFMFYDANDNFECDPGESYSIYNLQTSKNNATPVTFTENTLTEITINFDDTYKW